jgi:hypothetical protein
VLVPADVMEALFWKAAGPLAGDDEPSAVLLAGMMVCAADGMLLNIADTPQNRREFGCTGTAEQDGEGAAPFPQVRIVALTARAGRAMLGAILGRARAGEQTLLARLVRRRPDLVAGRVLCFDRNFPGYELITAILAAGGHVVARVKAGISLPVEPGGWLPDGSRLTWLNAPSGKKEDRLAVRAAEHNVILPCSDGEEASETCTLITTLLDHRAAPAGAVREAYLTRWSASETSGTHDERRKRVRNSRTHPGPSQPSPENPRSPCSHPASHSQLPGPESARKEEPPRWAADRGTARQTRRDTRANNHALTPPPPSRKQTQGQRQNTRADTPRNTVNT